MITITNKTRDAIAATWDSIADDAYELCDGDNEIAMEFALDANRLTINGFNEADIELNNLYSEFGFAEVREFLAKQIQLL